MTGLFQRLARQVVGPPPPRARTAARLPFAYPPTLEHHAVAASPGPTAARTTPAPDAPNAAAAEATMPQAQHAEPPVDVSPVRAEANPEATEPPPIPRPIAAADRLRRTEADTASDPSPPARGPLLPEEKTPFSAVSAETTKAPAETGEMAVAHVEPSTPPPLMPEAGAGDPVTPPARPPRHPRPASGTESPNEVHVHIGRVEVTSVSEPQPRARERPRRGKEPMSLEQYLARRRSEGA